MELLAVRPGGFYVDATLGAGGHARAIAERGGRVLGVDRDRESLERTRQRLSELGEQLELLHMDFRRLPELIGERGLRPDGWLLDLGLSSDQLLDPERGFSFALPGPLDMRMDRGQELTAARLVATLGEEELSRLLWRHGEEPASRRIARAIVRRRRSQPLETTAELAQLVREVKGAPRHRPQRIDPATRTFQALRIAVNSELEGLEDLVHAAVESLAPDGRFVAISFHSLEDRAVKHSLRALARACICPPRSPICNCGHRPLVELLTRKPVRPGPEELAANPRSRSARLRAARRLAA